MLARVKPFAHSTVLFWLAAWPAACTSWGKFWQTPELPKITSYMIPAINATGIITGNQISVIAPTLTALSPQVATFTTTGQSITVSGVTQQSGVTSNDYTAPLIYQLTGADGGTATYTVTLTAPRVYGGSRLRLWLRADSLALADGADIASWNDESGIANHMAQATVDQRPIFRSGRVNGLPVVSFTDLANSTMSGPASGFTEARNGSFFAVFALTANTDERILMHFAGAGNENGRQYDFTEPPDSKFQLGRNGLGWGYTSTTNLGLGSFKAVSVVQSSDTIVAEFWNGDLIHQQFISCCGIYAFGATNFLSNGNLEGEIAEIMYFDTALSQVEQDKVFCYLNTKYNLASTRRVCDS